MKRRTFKQLRAKMQPELHHNVYVVLLAPAVGKLRKVHAENPKRDPKKPCVYVGMTGLTPEGSRPRWRGMSVRPSSRQSGLSGAEKALKQPQGRARFPFPMYRPGNRKRETKRPGGLVFGDLPAISPEDILCKVMPTEEQARPQYMPSDPSDPSGGFQNSLQRPL
jgi:hypothetical protein